MNFNKNKYFKYQKIAPVFWLKNGFLAVFFLVSLLFRLDDGNAAERIISLKPNITEILFELNFGNQIVGVSTFCDYPKEAQKIDKIADYVHIDLDKVLVKRPTLVFGSKENSNSKQVEFLMKRGIRVHLYPFGSLDEIYESMVAIAEDLKVKERGEKLVFKMKKDLLALSSKPSKGRSTSRLIMIVGKRPLMVVGGNNFINDLMTELGFSNVAGKSRLRYPNYSVEQLILSKPDVLVDLSMGSEQGLQNEARKWYEQFPSLPAVKNKRVYFLDIGNFRPSPRIVRGAKELVDVVLRNKVLTF